MMPIRIFGLGKAVPFLVATSRALDVRLRDPTSDAFAKSGAEADHLVRICQARGNRMAASTACVLDV